MYSYLGVAIGILGALIAAGLVLATALRRPPYPLWPSLLFIYLTSLLWITAEVAVSLFEVGPLVYWYLRLQIYTGIIFLPAFWWVLSYRYEELLKLRAGGPHPVVLYGPLALALLSYAAYLSNPWHGLYVDISPERRSNYGPIWYANAAMAFATLAYVAFRYIRMWHRLTRPDLRAQALIMIAASLVPIPFNFLYTSKLVDPGIDTTVFGLALSGLLFFAGVYRFQLFALGPIHVEDVIRGTMNALFLLDRSRRLVEVNPAAVRLLGAEACRPGADVLAHLEARVKPDEAGSGGQKLQSLIRMCDEVSPPTATDAFAFDHPEVRHVQINISALKKRRNAIAGYGLEVHDVTALFEARQQLRAFESDFLAVLRRMPDPILIYRRGSIYFVNEAATHFLGRSAEEIVSRSAIEILHPDERPSAIDLQPLIESGADIGLREMVFLRGDGTSIHGEVRVVPMTFERRRAVFVSIRDLTERKKAEAERQRRQEEIQRRLRLQSLGVLAGGMAHDFNNLLQGIAGNCEMAMNSLPPDAPERMRLQRALEAGDRAAELVGKILAYAGKGKLQDRLVELGPLLRSTVEDLGKTLSPRARVSLDLKSECVVAGDPAQLRQLVMNVLLNASESLEDREGTIEIVLDVVDRGMDDLDFPAEGETAGAGPHAQIEVRDSGSGIRSDDLGRIFEPFFTTRFMGRGLGLPAALGIARAHAGDILVSSTPGKGSTFRILLPLAEGEVASPPSPAGRRA